jgi:hypothetical protein
MIIMKLRLSWAIAPVALAVVLANASVVSSNPVQTPLASPVVITGNSGGSESNPSCRGFSFPNNPNQVVRVTESAASLRFRVEGSDQFALLITGTGNPICIPASGGTIEIPGVWQQGTYSVFVGDRSGSNPFTLSISQEN